MKVAWKAQFGKLFLHLKTWTLRFQLSLNCVCISGGHYVEAGEEAKSKRTLTARNGKRCYSNMTPKLLPLRVQSFDFLMQSDVVKEMRTLPPLCSSILHVGRFFPPRIKKKMVLVRWLVHHSKIWQKPFRWKLEILISLPSHVSWKSRKFSSKHHLVEDPGLQVAIRSNIIYF